MTLAEPTLLTRVVSVDGEVDLACAARLEVLLEEALEGHPRRLVVDLSGCAFVDATALAVLLEAHRTARRRGGEMVLRGVSPRVERLLALTGVTGVFALEDSTGRAAPA